MSKRFLIILAVIALAFVGFLWFSNSKETKAPSDGQATNHVTGGENAKVTLVEYGDFECPACGSYYPIVEQVKEKYGDKLKFQFRHFPLVQIHKNAMVGHRAAEAAGRQGKFWQMYNILYKQQQTWTAGTNAARIMEDYALQIGLNIDQFKKDFASESVNDAINADTKAGQALGANSTPTFILNGKKLDPLPDRSVEAFSKLIDEALKEANSQQAQPQQNSN